MLVVAEIDWWSAGTRRDAVENVVKPMSLVLLLVNRIEWTTIAAALLRINALAGASRQAVWSSDSLLSSFESEHMSDSFGSGRAGRAMRDRSFTATVHEVTPRPSAVRRLADANGNAVRGGEGQLCVRDRELTR